MSDLLIRCENAGKKFCRDLKRSLWYGIQDLTADILPLRERRDDDDADLRPDEFWAVENASFELRRGECLGLIGRNGAGKTTLLKMLNGLIKPDRGRIMLRGRVGGLIALGAGFDPILTGRENVFINGAILGLSQKQIKARFEEIVEFAEIGPFIDTPVCNYSSGMHVRLGFAVAAVLIKPDVLLLDEVLAVGDLGFRLKCFNLVQELLKDSAAVFVSHSMQQVTRFCTHVAVLANGQMIRHTTDLGDGLAAYYDQCESQLKVFGNEQAVLHNEQLLINHRPVTSDEMAVINPDDELSIEFDLDINPSLPAVQMRVLIEDFAGLPVVAIHPDGDDQLKFSASQRRVRIDLGRLSLSPGKYGFSFAIVIAGGMVTLTRKAGQLTFQFGGDYVEWASVTHQARVIRAKAA